MRFVPFSLRGREGLALEHAGQLRARFVDEAEFPGTLETLLAAGGTALHQAGERLLQGAPVEPDAIEYLPIVRSAEKIICVGLNYRDHSKESGYTQPDYPTVFTRVASSFIGHGQAIIRPKVSTQLDYEGELVAILGKGGRSISKETALEHVAGYSIFNDGSIRDFQKRTPQWTVGKNFDGTGAFGPVFVTADELPAGCRGLQLTTRLNGTIMQQAPIDDMVFDVATLIAILSEAMTLRAGDVIVTGTPAGVGAARTPPVFMKPGDECTIEIDSIGVLKNPIADQE